MTPEVIVHHPIPDDLHALLNGLGYAPVEEASSYTRFARTRTSSGERDRHGRRATDGLEQTQRVLYTPEQSAVLLGVGRTTVYKLINAGELRSVTIGRCRRIAATELERFVEALAGSSLMDIKPSAAPPRLSTIGTRRTTSARPTFAVRRSTRKPSSSPVRRAAVAEEGTGLSVPLSTVEPLGTSGASQPSLPLDP